MALIGNEIIQSRVWIDPTNPPPNLNYKNIFPITVFDAVRKDMLNENSETLTQILNKLGSEIKGKQNIIPAKPSNYLMTYAGVAGAVGSIQISKSIPWEEEHQSNSRIPTEKAVGDLIRQLGVDPNDPDSEIKIRWSDIIGRPQVFNSLGNDEYGLVTQAVITKEILGIKSNIEENDRNYNALYNVLRNKVDNHVLSVENPHQITIETIGAASELAFENHINSNNPHSISAETIGLENVDNTADIDKPISAATKIVLDRLENLFNNMTDDVGDLRFITDIEYDNNTGFITLIYRNGSTIVLDTPIEESISNILYDSDSKELVMITHNNEEHRLSLTDLFIRYIGSEGTNITVSIKGDQNTGDQVINAVIKQKSITTVEIADDAITNRNIKDDSVSAGKIRDGNITSIKLANRSVTNEKINNDAVKNYHISSRAVNGRTLFSSDNDNMILATVNGGQDPVWTLLNSEMIGYNVIQAKHIDKYAVTHDKIANEAVGTLNIEDLSVTTEKIKSKAVTTDKLEDESVSSSKLSQNLIFEGIPKIRNTPNDNSDNNEIPDTRWIRKFSKDGLVVESNNIGKRSVTGEKLFSSTVRNRVLSVLKVNQDPEWSQINNEMMGIDAVDTSNIINNAVTGEKIKEKSIFTDHLNKDIILSNHITESAITSEKIYTSFEANRVLAALNKDGHPTYSQVTLDMMANNSVGAKQILDGSIPPVKLESSKDGQQVMTVGLKNAIPGWSKVMTQMINDRAVDGSKLFTSENDNVILGLTRGGFNPTWIKVTGDMIANNSIKSVNIGEKIINSIHIADNGITSNNIAEGAIKSEHLSQGSVKPSAIETSPHANRIIGINALPYSLPTWTQVNTDMIEDQAITNQKIFKSNYPYRVLGTTQAGTPPEYTMITHQFIVDDTIIPEKLKRNFILRGTPELTISPEDESDDLRLANTAWVRKTINSVFSEKIPEWKFDVSDIPDHAINGSKLFTHPYGPRVLGITAPNEEVEFILIEEDLIANGAITTNKLQRNIHLLGSPIVEVRPAATASDSQGNGQNIPDCQWVLDRIKDKINDPNPDGAPVPAVISPGSVTKIHIQDRAVDGTKLFTSVTPRRLLGVMNANTSPMYLQAVNDMIGDRAINGRTLFSSNEDNRILGTANANNDPKWMQINSGMIGNKVVNNNHIIDRSITENNIATCTINDRVMINGPVINEIRLFDDAVSERKIQNNAITKYKIADESITSSKLANDLVLPKETVIKTSTNYEKRSLRNIIISNRNPHGGRNGDIWFKFS